MYVLLLNIGSTGRMLSWQCFVSLLWPEFDSVCRAQWCSIISSYAAVTVLLSMEVNGRRACMTNGCCSSLFLCWPMKEVRVDWLTATVKSWPAVTDREAGALTLIAGWQASCFLQQGNICRNTQQIY